MAKVATKVIIDNDLQNKIKVIEKRSTELVVGTSLCLKQFSPCSVAMIFIRMIVFRVIFKNFGVI